MICASPGPLMLPSERLLFIIGESAVPPCLIARKVVSRFVDEILSLSCDMADPVCPVQSFTGTKILSPGHIITSIPRMVEDPGPWERRRNLRRGYVRLLMA